MRYVLLYSKALLVKNGATLVGLASHRDLDFHLDITFEDTVEVSSAKSLFRLISSIDFVF